ncbi:MAG: IclR family transcriptional regulator [Acidimicrobiia bacterium]
MSTATAALIDSIDDEVCDDALGDGELSSSVGKALSLLITFDGGTRVMGVSELARRAGLPKSTAFRLLRILVLWGLVERVGNRYSLGARVCELAEHASDSNRRRIRDLALPYLQDLYETTHETIHLAVRDGADVVYLEKLYGHNRVQAPSRVGGRLNAGCSALGKAMLAFSDAQVFRQVVRHMRPHTRYTIMAPNALASELRIVRGDGVAYDREESALGVTCVAAPIIGAGNQLIGAVSIAGPVHRFDPTTRASAVRGTASAIASAVRCVA